MKKYIYLLAGLIILAIFLGANSKIQNVGSTVNSISDWFRKFWNPLTQGK